MLSLLANLVQDKVSDLEQKFEKMQAAFNERIQILMPDAASVDPRNIDSVPKADAAFGIPSAVTAFGLPGPGASGLPGPSASGLPGLIASGPSAPGLPGPSASGPSAPGLPGPSAFGFPGHIIPGTTQQPMAYGIPGHIGPVTMQQSMASGLPGSTAACSGLSGHIAHGNPIATASTPTSSNAYWTAPSTRAPWALPSSSSNAFWDSPAAGSSISSHATGMELAIRQEDNKQTNQSLVLLLTMKLLLLLSVAPVVIY